MLNKNSFIKPMHMAASVRPMSYRNHSTAQLIENENNSQVSYRFQITNLQTQPIVTSKLFVHCQMQQYCNGHNHAKNFVMAVFTLKTILNEKVGYHFCPVILLFWLQQKVVPDMKYKSNHEDFYQKISQPLEKRQTVPTEVTIPGWKPLL